MVRLYNSRIIGKILDSLYKKVAGLLPFSISPTKHLIGFGKLNKKFIKTLILLQIFTCSESYANYGESCATVAVSLSDTYFISSTGYGYLLNNIDMKTNVPSGCNQPKDKIQFCIRNRGLLPCDLVTMGVGEQKKVSAISTNPDIGGNSYIGNILLRAEVIDANLCLVMPTSRGLNPLICRKIETADTVLPEDTSTCKPIGKACYRTTSKSQSLINFSGLTIQCLTETLDTVFFEGTNCKPEDESIALTTLTPFAEFQEALKVAIRGALILYVMIFGFKIILNIENPELHTIVMFVIKFLLVAYFSVGLGPLFYESGRFKQQNGMTEVALPALVDMTSSFTQIVFKSMGTQGLCSFDQAKYEKGYEYYGLWDSIDCRIGFYMGMQAIYNMSSVIKSLIGTVDHLGYTANNPAAFGSKGTQAVAALDDAFNLSLFTVLFGFFMAGNIVVVLCGVVFAVVFISILLYFLTTYLVCIVTLYVLAYISPIFIPLALFDRTKSYFDAWLKIVVSCTLQPAVIGAFIAMLVTMYDSAIYGNCEYTRYDYSLSDVKFSTFELRLPTSEPEKCSESAGYKLVKYYMGQGWEEKVMLFFAVPVIRDVFNLTIGLVNVAIFTFIFYFIMGYISEFASDLTSGPNVEAVTASPTMIINAAMKAAKWVDDARNGKVDIEEMKETASEVADGKNRPEGASDKTSTGGDGSGGSEAVDKVASGGGGSGGGATGGVSGGGVTGGGGA